jgi:putative transposase
MLKAREDVLAFRDFPAQNRRKTWSINLLKRVNVAPKRVLSSAVITRLVEAVLLEQYEHYQLKGRRMFSAESMAAIP